MEAIGAMDNTGQTVRFNVGGDIYEVSRSLLSDHPTTLMAKIASKTWQQDGLDQPYFIDGDGERFRYCLDYMRRGRVYLPLTVSKGSLLQDLDYYGFEGVDESLIDGSSTTIQAVAHLAKREVHHTNELEEYDDQIREIQIKRRCVVVAHACFKDYSERCALDDIMHTVTFDPDYVSQNSGKPSEQHLLYEQATAALRSYDDDAFFNECLASYGFFLVKAKHYSRPSCAQYGYKVTLGLISEIKTTST